MTQLSNSVREGGRGAGRHTQPSMSRERGAPDRLAHDATWATGAASAWSSSRAKAGASRAPAAKAPKSKCSPARYEALKRARAARAALIEARKKKEGWLGGAKSMKQTVVVPSPSPEPESPYGSPEMQARIKEAAEHRLCDMIRRYSRVAAGVADEVRADDYNHLRQATEYVAYLAAQLASDDLQGKVKAARAAPPDWMVLLSMTP